MALEVRLNDYVEYNHILGNSSIKDKKDALLKDYRTANLQLVNSSNAEVLSSVPIRQFNAITVNFDYDNKSYTTGFSRLDFGDQMGDNGVALGDGAKLQWGFYGTYRYNFWGTLYFDDNVNGEADCKQTVEIEYEGYKETAMYKVYKKVVLDGLDKYWYLPAREEFKSFVQMSYNNTVNDVLNIRNNSKYWTTSTVGVDLNEKSYTISTPSGNEYGENRNELYYCRQAIKFPN